MQRSYADFLRQVRILGPTFAPGRKTDLWVKPLPADAIVVQNTTEIRRNVTLPSISAGNLLCLVSPDFTLLSACC